MDRFLSFLEGTGPAGMQVREVLNLVELALDACDEGDERYPYLVAMEDQLLQGSVPENRLGTFLRRFPRQPKAALQDLESEFRSIAGALHEEVWCTATYLELEAAFEDFDGDGDELRLLDYLEVRRERIHQVLDSYASQTLVSDEVTLESVVGHRLLTEGLQSWLAALDLAEVNLQQREASWEGPLEAAERGNRLLLATQKLHLRVASQAPSEIRTEGAVL